MRPGGFLTYFFRNGAESLRTHVFIICIVSIPVTAVSLYLILFHGLPEYVSPFKAKAFFSGPRTRGTLNIIWSSVSTIYTCVYLSVHLDIRDRGEMREYFERQKCKVPPNSKFFIKALFLRLRRFIKTQSFVRRGIWMVFNIFAPELIVFTAILERMSASDNLKCMRERGEKDWNMKLAFFADMGGFQLSALALSDDMRKVSDGTSFLLWYDAQVEVNKSFKLDVQALLDEIDDRRNANGVLKAFTCVQALCFVIETISRLAAHQPISTLELTTCTYIFCALTSYILWWDKPYDIDGKIKIYAYPPLPSSSSPEFMTTSRLPLCNRGSTQSTTAWHLPQDLEKQSTASAPPVGPSSTEAPQVATALSEISEGARGCSFEQTQRRLPNMLFEGARSTPFNRSFLECRRAWIVSSVGASMLGAAVGVIHGGLFWDATFVFATGRWLWRASCIVQVAVPTGMAICPLIEMFYHRNREEDPNDVHYVFLIPLALMTLLYAISRMALFVLIGISFWSLPKGVYDEVDWSRAWFPHWY